MKSLKSSWRLTLPMQILICVVLGVLLGLLFPGGALSGLSEFGKLVIQWVKLIAGPFLFATILLAVIEVKLRWSHGLRLLAIALLNTAIAISIGVFLTRTLLSGSEPLALLNAAHSQNETVKAPEGARLDFSSWLSSFSPQSLFDPFVRNDILLIALFALALGIAIRQARDIKTEHGGFNSLVRAIDFARDVLAQVLHWIIRLIPLAVLAVIAGAVSRYGLGIFASLGNYVLVVFLGFTLHIVFVYGTWLFGVARLKPKNFWRHAKAPVLYALGVNSSLATLPLTLEALKNLGVSDRSASLGAGVATNLNNDGIVLYEATAVFFIAIVHQIPMEPGQMVIAALTCVVAAIGITGIPEAGFISLSVVIGVLGLPADLLPLLLAVDWIIARARSAVNVLSDMTLAIALDATEKTQSEIPASDRT